MRLRRLLFEGEILRLMSFTMLIKPLAMITQMLLARYFGAGAELDAFNFTLFLVTFLGFASGNAFTTVIVPQITKVRAELRGRDLAAYQNAVLLIYYVPVVVLLGLMVVRGDLLVDLAGQQLPPETHGYAVKMIRWLAGPACLLGLVKLLSAILNLNRQFRIPGLMLPLHTVFLLAALAALQGRMGIWALPAGWTISYVLQSILIVGHSLRTKALQIVRPALPEGALREIWDLGWVVFVGQSLLLISGFVDKWFAASLPVGSISYISYATVLMNFGHQLFSLSLVVVMFTRISEMLSRAEDAACDRYLMTNIVKVSHLVVPVSLALFVVSPEVVRVMFQRGAFTAADAIPTAGTLGFYMLGLPAMIINGVVSRIFHSLRRFQARIWLNLQYILTNVAGNIILVKTMATMGLALASTIAINVHVVLSLALLLRYRTGLRPMRYMAMIGVTYAMGGAAYGIYLLSGCDGWAARLADPDTMSGALVVGTVKGAVVLGAYALQVPVFMRYYRRLKGGGEVRAGASGPGVRTKGADLGGDA